MSESDDKVVPLPQFEARLAPEAVSQPVIGPYPPAQLAAVAALPSKEDPAKVEVQYCLAQAIAADFVEVIVIGVRTKKDGGGFVWFGSSQDPVRSIGMVEVCKRDMLNAMRQEPPPKTPGAA